MVRFYNKEKVVKERMIYVDRYLKDNMTKDIYIDVRLPQETVDSAGVSFWGESITQPLYIDNLKVWTFDE